MSRVHDVRWFDPRGMRDEAILQLATGRDVLLRQLLDAIHERLVQPGTLSHWLLTGNRGAGKSFFLRLLQAKFAAHFAGRARFVLLPEEHSNIFAAHEFLAETERMLSVEQGATGAPPSWKVSQPDAAWTQALDSLLAAFSEPLLVIGVENFDQLLEQAFTDDADNARLRHLMSNQPRLMLVATAVHGHFDEQYHQRLFRQFEHHPIPPWDGADHRDYLNRRAARARQTPSPIQLARLEAYSHYTGGNARAAAVLAGFILDEDDPLAGALDLDAAIEKMSDYYRDLLKAVPTQSRKLLDALIRGGEPASQSEVAERAGARQSDISRAFAWLVDHGYVNESRLPGAKAKQYRLRDRLLVQYYRMRYLHPGQRSKLALMAELLADTLAFPDKWQYANRYIADGQEHEAQTLLHLALQERQVLWDLLPTSLQNPRLLCAVGGDWAAWDAILAAPKDSRFEEMLRRFPDDASFKRSMESAYALARAASREEVSGEQLAPMVWASLSLNPAEKFRVLISMLSPSMSAYQWRELGKVFEEEVQKFAELAEEYSNEIDRLHARRTLGEQYPRTQAMTDVVETLLAQGTHPIVPSAELPTIASWASEAALAWLAAEHQVEADAALETCCRALQKMQEDVCYPPEQVLMLCQPLLAVQARFSPALRCMLYERLGIIQMELGLYAEALASHTCARDLAQQAEQTHIASWNLAKMAWNLGQSGQPTQALALHQQAQAERLAQQNFKGAAWNLGQVARHTASLSSLDAAWALLDAELVRIPGHEVVAVQQLADAVADAAQQRGEASAFALGKTMLLGLAQRPALPTEAVLRAWWIDMVEMAVPHSVLHELLDEWPVVFAEQASSLETLRQILCSWLDDLDTPAEQRAYRRQTLDPDLAATLTALDAALPPHARRRLRLLPPPTQEDSDDK